MALSLYRTLSRSLSFSTEISSSFSFNAVGKNLLWEITAKAKHEHTHTKRKTFARKEEKETNELLLGGRFACEICNKSNPFRSASSLESTDIMPISASSNTRINYTSRNTNWYLCKVFAYFGQKPNEKNTHFYFKSKRCTRKSGGKIVSWISFRTIAMFPLKIRKL